MKNCAINIIFQLEEIEMYKGDVTLTIDNDQKVSIPVFTGGKSNVVIEPEHLAIMNKNPILENSDITFKVRNNNPFKVVFCWMQGKDIEDDNKHLLYLTEQAKKMISKEKEKAMKRATFDQIDNVLKQIKKKEQTILDALNEYSKFFYH